MLEYFNHTFTFVDDRWQRRQFASRWWSFYGDDRRWPPPYFPNFWRLWLLQKDAHIQRLQPRLVFVDAIERRPVAVSPLLGAYPTGAIEQAVAAVIVLNDRRREDGVACLAGLHCVNHVETLQRLLDVVVEEAAEAGMVRLAGPTGLSADLDSGLLVSHFDRTPPLHTPYNPPYMAELLESSFNIVRISRLYRRLVEAPDPASQDHHLRLQLLDVRRLADDLLPLFQSAWTEDANLSSPDALQAAFALRWWQSVPMEGWLALWDNSPVGFVLLQPDLAQAMQRAAGGRNLLWRAWLAWRLYQPARSGRLLLGAVLPAWRGRGIGRALWQKALGRAYAQGWQNLAIGPLADDSEASAIIRHWGAEMEQRYHFYTLDFM